MGYWDDASDLEKPGSSSQELSPGDYPALEVLELVINKGHHGLYFIANFKVLAEARVTRDGTTPTPVGASGSIKLKFDGSYAKDKKAKAKDLVATLMGKPFESVTQADLEAATERNALKGARCAGEVWTTVTGNGHTMTLAKFRPAEGGVTAASPVAPPPPPAAPKADPFEGYIVHPSDSAWYYHPGTSDIKPAAEVLATRGA